MKDSHYQIPLDQAALASGLNDLPPEGVRTRRRRLIPIQELDQLEDQTWIVDDLIADETICLLYGPPSSFKTFIGLGFALSVAAARAFAHRKVVPGPVVYICAEGQRGLKWRVKAWLKAHQESSDLPFWTLPAPVAFDEELQVTELLMELRALPRRPRLIVVDTVARTFGSGDESNSKDMNAYLATADLLKREFGGSVLLIHHSAKKQADEPRGSSVLLANADTVLKVEFQSQRSAKLEVVKQRDTDAGECFEITMSEEHLERDAAGRQRKSLAARLESAKHCSK